MKTSKHSAPFLSTMRRNKLAQVIALALAGVLNLRVAEAEADDAVAAVDVDEQNRSSAAALDIDQLAPSAGTAQAKLLGAGWQGIPYNLDPANANSVTDAGQHTAFNRASVTLMGQIGYLVQNGGTLNAADSTIDAQANSSKMFVALDGGKIDLRGIQMRFAGQANSYENQAAALLAVGDGSVINAKQLNIAGAPVAGSAVVALGGGQINLDQSVLNDGHSIQVQDAGSSISLKDSEVGGAWVQRGSMAIDDSTVHGTLFVVDGGQVDIRHSTLDSQLPGGSATLQINNDWSDQQARVSVVDSQIIKGPTVGNQAVEITGGVDFSMTGGRIEAADTGIAALRGMGGGSAAQTIVLDGVQVQVHDAMDGQRMARGMVIADGGGNDSGHTNVTLHNTEVNVSAEHSATFEESASGLNIYGKGIDVLLDQSTVTARIDGGNAGTGAKLAGSDARIELINGSQLVGQDQGVHVSGRNFDSSEAARLIVDNSAVIGENASAVQADTFSKLDVRVQNAGSLQSGNGIAVNVQGQAEVNLTVDNSHVRGDIVSDNQVAEQVYGYDPVTGQPLSAPFKSGASVTLQNQATLSGAARQVDALSVDGSSQWNVTADSDVGRLHNDGDVAFASAGNGFKNLIVHGDLSGNGSFHMNTDLAALQGDLLTVEGQTQGTHTLVVADSGRAPSAAEQQLMLVDGHGGDGQFNLYGNHVDAGAFRYTLEQQGDDWFLRNTAANSGNPAPENLSTSANAALGNQAATATLWNAQMNALVKRLGELRLGEDKGGVWARGIGKHFDVDNGNSRGFDQDVVGMEIGADTAIPLDGGKLYVGGMLGTARSDQDFGEGASGQIDSKLIGAYATWLDENGYYVDTVAKYNRFDNNVKSTTNVGEQVKGDYKTQGYGADIEVGKHVKLQDGWFIEPQVELSYTHTGGAHYDTSNGMRVEAADSDSLQGRVGSLFGRSLKLDNGMHVQPYVKASYVHEFNGNSEVSVNGIELDNHISGSRTELGLGGVLQVSEKTKLSLDVEQASGDDVEQPWAINLGVRFLW